MGRELVHTNPQIDESTLKNLRSFHPVYHADKDTFFLRPDNPRPATSLDWDGELWLRFIPDTGEVIGLEIENFEAIFIKKHPEIGKIWKDFKPLCLHKRTKKCDEPRWESFVRILIQFIANLFQTNPLQASLPIS